MTIIQQAALFDNVPSQQFKIAGVKRPPKPRTLFARVIQLGAGVQSSTLVEMVIEGDLDYPVDLVLFADTGNEPRWVYKQVEYLRGRCQNAGIEFAVVKKDSQGIVQDAMHSSGRFAKMPFYIKDSITGKISIMQRQCTKEYKIEPCDDYLKDWLLKFHKAKPDKLGRRYVNRDIYIEQWYGISAEETYRAGKRGQQWQQAVYPLIDKNMKRADCIKYLLKKCLPVPKKSSCKVCPFHDDEYWLMLSIESPDEFEEACVYDDWLRTPAAKKRFASLRGDIYLHFSGQPLRSIDFKTRIEARKRPSLDMFAVELLGASCKTDGGFSCNS